jgi:hypothetical protein
MEGDAKEEAEGHASRKAEAYLLHKRGEKLRCLQVPTEAVASRHHLDRRSIWACCHVDLISCH